MPEWLRDRLVSADDKRGIPTEPPARRVSKGARIIPARTRLLLEMGRDAEPGRYSDRSRLFMAIMQGLVNAGIGIDEIVALVMNPHHRGGEKIQAMSLDVARRYIEGRYKKACQRQRPAFRDASDALRVIDEIEAAARSPLPLFVGQGGETRRLVVLILCEIARQRRSLTFGESTRDLAERVGIERYSASRALGALRRAAVLGKGAGADKAHRRAGEWTLRPPTMWRAFGEGNHPHHSSFTGDGGLNGADSSPYLVHDAWSAPPGLGKTLGRLWSILDGRPASSLAARRGVGVHAIRKQLNKLRDVGLAGRDPSGRWHRTERNLDDVARELGVYGRGETRKLRHQRERAAFDATVRRRAISCEVDQSTGEVLNPPSCAGETSPLQPEDDYEGMPTDDPAAFWDGFESAPEIEFEPDSQEIAA